MSNANECEPTNHNFILLFVRDDYIGIICTKCGKKVKDS